MPRFLKFWRQYIAILLVFTLLISQTIRVDFFGRVEASQETYRDIVSIFVDTDTYKENRSKINRYAEDIQGTLGSTRTSIFVVEKDISPAIIAAQNEKLYYEGDGEEGIVSRLVGTILIGDIAIPVVDIGTDQFPSVYPYVDFVDKKFLYDEEAGRYRVAANDNQKIVEPEIWHGVINPAVGREFEVESKEADPSLSGSVDIISDVVKIGTFLDKTHDFYTQSGVFVPTTVPPRVFYYDGFLEAKSFAIEDLGAYSVYMDSAEPVIYNRFSKYFLKYVITKVEQEKKKFNKEELEYIDSLGFSGTTNSMFQDAEVDKTPDIQTKPMIMELFKKFYQLINAKSLGDIRGFVRNAGRYNDGTNVRMDQPAISISLMDYAAMNNLRKLNDKLEQWVDYVEIVNPFSTFIMDYLTIKEPFTPLGQGITRHYDNFLFGRKGSTIFDPHFCTIARGSDFESGPYKQGILVEANSAFDVYTTPESMKLYEKDGNKKIDCGTDDNNPETYFTDAYWGNNIITNVNTSNWTFKEPSKTEDFYMPIFSLSGMKEINQRTAPIVHIGPRIVDANPTACNAAYAPYPYMLQSGAIREDGPWPNDDGKSINDISCKTVPEEYSQPTWGGEGDPETRLLGMEWESHYLVGGDGQCANGMVAISIVGSSVSPTVPPYLWACLPPEVVCPEIPEKGKTHYQCIAPLITGYITTLIPMESEAPPLIYGACDGTPGKLFNRPCPYNAGNNQERYPEKLPGGGAYMSPCMVGMFVFNSAIAPNKNLNYPCFNLAMAVGSGATDENGNATNNQNNQNVSEESAIYSIQAITDHTTYETQSFHSIFNSRVFHKSPTDEEIQAAESSNITPSMAIDHDRHVIFMEESPANKDKKIIYANLFRFDEKDILERHRTRIAVNLTDAKGQERLRKYGSGAMLITAYRLELDRLGKEQWEGSLPSTEPKFFPPAPSCWGGQLVDSPACMPATVDGPLSDDDIVTAIRANRWLHPDVTVKMRQAIETGLAYSREYGSGGVTDIETITQALANPLNFPMTITGVLSSPPKILTLTGGYEIAYLGLTDFIPQGDDDSSKTITLDGGLLSDTQDQYNQGRSQIAALNISEQDAQEEAGIAAAPSDSCGPPEGVDLFEWPSAIMCWIKSLTPVRIIGQACGVNTIGLDPSLMSNSVFQGGGSSISSGIPVVYAPTDVAATVATLNNFYTGAKLTYHLSRDVMLPTEMSQVRFFYQKNNSLLSVPKDSKIRLDVVSITDKAGKSVDIRNANDYIRFTPDTQNFSEGGTVFLLQSQEKTGTITLRATLDIQARAGGKMQVQSDIITLHINSEYLLAVPSVGGIVGSQISVASATGMAWEFGVRNLSGATLETRYPITLDIYDDISGSITQTGITIQGSGYILPTRYTKTVGVYRLEFRDAAGRHATNTIAVTAGPIAKASLSPISSALLKGSNTLVTLRLRDALGNPVSPDLYSIDVTAVGGYFILENGEKKTTMHIDAIESEIPLTVGSDVPGEIVVQAQVEDTIYSEIALKVFDSARVIVSRVGTPEVGGSSIPVTVRVEDNAGRPLEGFRSVVHLSTGVGGGVFAPEVVMLDNGVSEPITYTPGRLAGEHRVTASIPGLGSVPDIIFSVNPGKPMYISHVEDEINMVFSLRDRYNNIVPVTLPGTLEVGGKPLADIVFSGGILKVEKDVGYMIVHVPALRDNSISFTDSAGTHTVQGISRYVARVSSLAQRFNFLEDYNARYTVLAGGTFLRESEDILYNTTPGSGQSLAVTTLMDTPYKRDTIFSILPGGGFILGDIADAIAEPYLSIDSGYPLVTVRDVVTNSLITQARYRPKNPVLDTCNGADCTDSLEQGAHIRLESTMTGISVKNQGGELVLMKGTEALVTIMENGMISHLPGVVLKVDQDRSEKLLFIKVVSGVDTLGHIFYKTDSNASLEYATDESYFTGSTVYLDDVGDFTQEQFSQNRLMDTVYGFRYTKNNTVPVYDDVKNAPEAVDSFGLTVESPGIGWKGSNRTLLSYAGGDTVGEATKWFHTYTMVNLGDPVAHNDKKAPGTELDGIDRSIGTQLTSPQTSPIHSYTQRDMDNDGYEDIVVLHTDGYVELLLNLGDRIRSRGNIAYIPDIIERGFSLGDFRKDGFADIIGVDTEGNFIILSNDKRQFTRSKLTVNTGAIAPMGVTQFRIRDMDNDTRDDIVYLTESGELGILYGTETAGYFDKKILDATLGLTLSDTPIKTGGAIYASVVPQVSLDSSLGGEGLDESLVWNEVYMPYRYTPTQAAVDVDAAVPEEFATFAALYASGTSSPEASETSIVKNFVRSEYAQAFNIDISKKYSLGSGSVLKSGERITVDITIRNTGTAPLRGVEYLDTIPTIFSTENTYKYHVKSGDTSTSGDFVLTSSSDYDTYFTIPDIPAGQSMVLSYELTALPTSYGELLVGDYEQGETGADVFGDVGFSTATTCGADMILWRSELVPRTYIKGTRSFADMEVPPEIATKIKDSDGDGIPDSLGDITPDSQQEILDSIEDRKGILDSIRGKPGNNATDSETPADTTVGTDSITTEEIADMAQEIADGLSCGFGGGGCMNFPINWAPLAPGNDPVIFGYPMGDGFRTDEGIPIFAGMTRFDWGFSPYCVTTPMIWPVSPLKMEAARACSFSNVGEAWVEAGQAILAGGERLAEGMATSGQRVLSQGMTDLGNNYQTADPANPASIIGAGGYLGIDSSANFLRIYATPTLTLGVGVAICMGTTARAVGGNPSPGIWPLAQVGNCIVVTDSLNMCKDDGSIADGDIRDVVGLGSVNDTWNAGNGSNAPGVTSDGGSCNIVAKTQEDIQNQALTQDIISYARSPDKTRLTSLYTSLSKKSPRSRTNAGPLLSLRGASADGALSSVDIEIDLAKPLTADNIVKLDNKRIAGFPEFIMDWVSRQTDELVTAFFTPPALVIIPPTTLGQNSQYDGTMSGLTDSFKSSFEENSVTTISTKAGRAYDDEVTTRSASTGLQARTRTSNTSAQTDLGKWIQEEQRSFDSVQDSAFKGELGKLADKGKGGISAIRAAYKLIGKLPLISISERTVPVDVPWILPQELDRYARSLDAYAKEVNYTLNNNCIGVEDQSTCLSQKANAGPLLTSINQNLKRIEEYKNFPIKLQKYITWKQRYLSQVLCYITEVQQMTTGWAKDNSIRFRKWAELWVLIRTIADSWQPILDIIAKKDAYCAVCHNERYNAKYWKYKLISLLIPSLPIIQMPRWPDIILDLSDVRLGILIAVPNFQFNLKPIRLPSIPRFSLPTGPGVTLAGLDLIPPIPTLPDLPDLPAIPTIKLPNLPPPPKLPKILSELKGVIDILKLWKLLECYLNKTPFVPEWSVGDVIAQRTERQGTNPLDFIDINLPQISIPTIREIRVSSHVNFEIRSEFITEFARSAVAPLNKFNADLGRGIPKKVGEDVNISAPENVTIDLQSAIPSGLTGSIMAYIDRLERDKDITLDTDGFKDALLAEFDATPELAYLSQELQDAMRAVEIDADREEKELLAYNEHKYDLLKQYIELQYDETANMQHVIDLLTEQDTTLASLDIERALMVSEDIQTRSSTLAARWNKESLASIRTDDTVRASDTISNETHALTRRVQRLAADVSGSPSAVEEEIALAAGYSLNFRGIYIVTANGTQTRLFDYTDSLQKDDISTKVDIDRDGDMDYLFLLDGALFLKRTSTYAPKKIVDTERVLLELTDESSYPTAPDFFSEYVSLPNNINLAYEPSRESESIWRTEFYDRYLEWDMVDRGEHDNSLSARHTLEIFRHDPEADPSEKKVLRSLERVDNPDAVIFEGPRMEVLTGSMEFILSPGRTLYTGDRPVTILYGTGTATPTIEKRLEAHRGYSIPEIANVSFEKGTLYIVYPSIVPERYTYSDTLIGMPILPGMRIAVGDAEVTLVDLVHDDDLVLTQNSLYHVESTIKLGEEYSLQLEYPNGFYHARLQNLDTKGTHSAGEVLFTPQASSDTSPPELDIRDTIRVPVYQEYELLLKDIVTDTNTYTLLVDTDISQDSDSNGVYDDDFVAQTTGISVTDTTLTFGPYDTIGNKNMMFKLTDEYYNTVYVPVTIQIYSPIPLIQESLGSGAVRGGLQEVLEDQPVHIFRVRTGTDILRLSSGAIMTNSGGVFESPAFFAGSGVQLSSSGQRLKLSEQGVVSSLPPGYITRVVLASETNPLSIVILDPQGNPLYRQILTLPDDAILIDNQSASGVTEGVVIAPADGYRVVSASVSDPSIPGGVYIVDSARRPLLAIARDGNIYPIASGVTAAFTQKDGHPQISLKVGGISFADVLYKFDFFYTLK